jgi:protein-L-isoaspartate O-methyltransferase
LKTNVTVEVGDGSEGYEGELFDGIIAWASIRQC